MGSINHNGVIPGQGGCRPGLGVPGGGRMGFWECSVWIITHFVEGRRGVWAMLTVSVRVLGLQVGG